MHVDLSRHLHTDECNILIEEYKKCMAENRFLRFLKVCDNIEIALERCLKRERLARQKLHNENAAKHNALIREKIHRAEQKAS